MFVRGKKSVLAVRGAAMGFCDSQGFRVWDI